MQMTDLDIAKKLFFEGLSHLDNQNFLKAESTFFDTLKFAPRSVPTLNNLAIALHKQNKIDEAADTSRKAIEIDANNVDAHLMLATCQRQLKLYQEALETYEKVISIDSSVTDAHCGRGLTLSELHKYQEALLSFDHAISIDPQFFDAHSYRGEILRILKQYDKAAAAYDRALTGNPKLVGAWLGRGHVFTDLKQYQDALPAYDKALVLKPDLAEAWLGRGNVFTKLRRYEDALAAYDKALALRPDLAEAWLGRGHVFTELNQDALAAYDEALALKPDLAEAWLGRGIVFTKLKQYEDALAAYDRAVALKPALAQAWLGRGDVFTALKRYEDALAAYDEALALNADLDDVEGIRLHTKMCLCDWSDFDAESDHLTSSVKNNKKAATPFNFLGISASPEDQSKLAKLWTSKTYPGHSSPVWHGGAYKHDRIRIAYISSDFRSHAMSHLIAGVIESHCSEHFDVTGIALQPEDLSEIGQRMKRAFGRFIDVSSRTDEEIAQLVHKLEIDIAIDLNGHTRNGRTAIFARRAAPLQVNYLGFPGTMGADYIDYLIADHTLVPTSSQPYYEEKIIYLPNSYQANDRTRAISDKVFRRADCKLPEDRFVFCCFNGAFKILPDVFDRWMRILSQVDGSVLWLLEDNETAASNLKKEAVKRGINAERLVFAARTSLADHLARHRLADLFLDTLPCNAHTTASDALWAGLPVLTQIGASFAGRVAASLLNAIGVPELITATPKAYEELAVELAVNPEKLSAIKSKLASNRLTTPLFDTQRFTKHIEAAYTAIYERHQANLPPNNIDVPD
jgi:protein O-GlcNAc transferase